MRKLLLSISLVMGLVTVGCQAQTASSEVVNIDVNVADFAAGLDTISNAFLLDVRTDAEFASGHLKGATQIDFYRDDFEKAIAALDKNQPVFVYCRSGNRSGKAAKQMKAMGFKEVYNLEGGIGAWSRRNQPISK